MDTFQVLKIKQSVFQNTGGLCHIAAEMTRDTLNWPPKANTLKHWS
ncbi:MAG: hypothetical protein ACLFR1_13780 [Spirochaetia bacterium]